VFPRHAPLVCDASLHVYSRVSLILACLAALAALPAPALAQGGVGGPPSGQPAPPAPAPAPPPPELKVERPGGRPLVHEGQAGRMLLGGTWYFRQDDTFVGDSERWYDQDDLTGWTAIGVPHNWNATDTIDNKATVGWYRKEFTLPPSPKGIKRVWKVRFEGANYRSKVWLNGKVIGYYTGYFPFEVVLDGLRKGRNTLVIKVSSLRSRTDLTHWRPARFNGYGTGGWWNFGGLLREVYVRPIDTIDIEQVQVLPHLRKVGGPAKVEIRTELRNYTRKDRDVTLVMDVNGERIVLRPETVPKLGRRELVNHFTIDRPKLWQPGKPELYPMTVSAATDGKRRSTYRLNFGVRKLEVGRGGVMMLNGHRLNLRGASIVEDDMQEGGALSQHTRNLLVSRLRDLGATVTRSQYPLHPALVEAFDRLGIMYWAIAPIWQVPNSYLESPAVRKGALRAMVLTVRNNINNASIFTWSLGNELAADESELGVAGPGFVTFARDASAAVRELDDTRFVGYDRQSRVGEPTTMPIYRYLDVLGVHDYFGWYRSYRADLPGASTLADLGPYLDSVHAANPNLGLMITEYGAEGTRPGPVEQPGSYEFQDKLVLDHLGVYQSKPYLCGSIIWALRDFRVFPTWVGGSPEGWATPPWHNKSPIEENNGRKPIYFDLRKAWRRTRPLR
jgi:beta-glucuronidase